MAKRKRELSKFAELVSEESNHYRRRSWFDKLRPAQQKELLEYKDACGADHPCWAALARTITKHYGVTVRSDSVSRWWLK